MRYVNELVVWIAEAGLGQSLYGTINTIFLYTSLLVGVLNGWKLKQGLFVTCFAVVVEYFLSGPIVSTIIFIEDGFWNSGRANGAYIFTFIPLIGWLVAKILRKSYNGIWDTLMVIPLTMFAGARIACTAAGCCKGIPFSWGVYNPKLDMILFPVQLVESLMSFLLLVYVFWREKKNNFVSDGRNVPIVLISYGIARFILEFFHIEIYYGPTWMQVHCIAMLIVGMICLRIIRKSEKQQMHLEPSVPLSVPAEELDKT